MQRLFEPGKTLEIALQEVVAAGTRYQQPRLAGHSWKFKQALIGRVRVNLVERVRVNLVGQVRVN